MSRKDLSSSFIQLVPELLPILNSFSTSNFDQQLSSRDVDSEFDLLRALTETKKHKQGLRLSAPMEARKNRYPEQSIYEHSRVLLGGSDYINANYVFPEEARVMIITQGPLESTLSDFNQMIKEHEISCIVMLCRSEQNGKPRCSDYLKSKEWRVIRSEEEGSLKISEAQIQGNPLTVEHLYFDEWPDRGVPADVSKLQPLFRKAVCHRNILIHCSAGLGRSGVVAAILNLLFEQDAEVSVFDCVRRMRQQRFGAVQNSKQYKFIYEYLRWHYSQK